MTEPSPADLAIAHLAAELTALRGSIEALAARLDARLGELGQVQDRLDASEQSRRELYEQMQHLLELLAESRTALNALRQQQG